MCSSFFSTNSSIKVPTICPTKDKEIITVRTEVIFQNFSTAFIFDVPKSVYSGAQKADRHTYFSSEDSKIFVNRALNNAYVFDKAQLPIINEVLEKFRKIKKTRNLSDDDFLELLVQYVQRIPYDSNKLNKWNNTFLGGLDTRFPVEVLVDKTGICSEKSYLLAALLSFEGYDVVLFIFDKEKHMGVGIAAPPEISYAGTGYAYIETTRLSLIGDTSGEYGNHQKITSIPEVVKIGTGTKRHNGLLDICKILKIREKLQEDIENKTSCSGKQKEFNEKLKEIHNLEKEIKDLQKSINGNLSIFTIKKEMECQQKINRYNQLVEEYNSSANNENKNIIRKNNKLALIHFIDENIMDKKKIMSELKRNGYLK